jgi:phosphoribosyl 1,2-cyclic phosphodiesterase
MGQSAAPVSKHPEPCYLRFWGVRGSYAAPVPSHLGVGGNTSCVELRCGSTLLVCDAGTGIIPLGEHLLSNAESQELLVLLTHYHWDHICGLPFFAPAFLKNWSVQFFGPGQSAGDIERSIAAQMKAPYFPVETETWQARVAYASPLAEGLMHGPFEIDFRSVHHPGVTYGYRIRVAGKLVVYVSDNEFMFLDRSLEQQSGEMSDEDILFFNDIRAEERSVELDLIRDADILIHDAQYTPEAYSTKRGWGHSCFIDTVNAAIDANVKTLYLYHHDPGSNDEQVEQILAESRAIVAERKSKLRCEIAREGLVVHL